MTRHTRFSHRRGQRSERGQAIVEFALALPMFAMFIFVVIQLALLFVAYYSETRMARETARWLAIHSSSTDDAVATHVQSTMLPGLVNGPISSNLGDTTEAKYEVGSKMTVTFPSCTTTPCTNPNRAPGATTYVQMSYDVRNLLFLPSTFHFGGLTVAIPTQLPAYRVYVMVE